MKENDQALVKKTRMIQSDIRIKHYNAFIPYFQYI